MFPRNGLLSGIAAVAIFYLCGLSGSLALFLGVVTFLVLGGGRYCRILAKTLPRDIRILRVVMALLREIGEHTKSNTTIADLFVRTVNRHPDKIAIIDVTGDRKWTFRELNEYSNRVANHFRSRGLQRGDIVALFVENSPEFLGLFIGLAKIGAVSAFINFNLRQEALAHCIRVSEARSVVFSASLSEAIQVVLPDLDPSLSDMCYSVSGESEILQAKSLDRELEKSLPWEPEPPTDKTLYDVLCYIYTSGTTGLPKACVIHGTRYFRYACGVNKSFKVLADDIVYCTLPLYHTNGGILSSGQMIIWGCTLALRKKFSASNFWTDCGKHKCTVVFYIGELCRYLLSQPIRPTDSQHCVRMAIGNGLRPQIWETFQKRFQVRDIREFYGATEGNVSTGNTVGKVGACGFVSIALSFMSPVVLIKVDPDTGEHIKDRNGYRVHAGVNEPGELVGQIKKRVTEFDGYKNREATKKKLAYNVFKKGDAYFLTGDILRMDEEGFLYFCDRTGDTFRWKGENVSTMEVEGTIGTILDLRDVVVYGVEIPGMEGKAGMAVIVGTEETLDIPNLAERLRQSLPTYAIPIFLRLVEEVKITGNFKYKKVDFRSEGFNLDVVSDPLYFLDPTRGVYVPLTSAIHQQLVDGYIRL